jgi:hypothetical protein
MIMRNDNARGIGKKRAFKHLTMMTPEAFRAIVREQEARRKEGNVVGISAAQRLLGRINPPGREKTS